MANYTKSTNFAVKDTLTTGDPQKIVSGVEIDTEFVNISSMSSTKVDKVGGAVAGNIATLTSGGSVQDSGTAISDISDLSDDVSDLTEVSFGQTWTDFTSSRSNNVTYTNSTGKAIMVEVIINQNTGSNKFFVDSNELQQFNTVSEPVYFTVGTIVPDGSTYSVSAGSTIVSWWELR